MIFGIIIVGAVLIATALKNTQHELGQQLGMDLLGKDGFIAWAGAVLGLGAIGYLPGMQQTSRELLLLVAVVIVVRNGGLFSNVQQALLQASASGPAPSIPAPASSAAGVAGGSGGSSGGSSGGGSNVAGTVGSIAGAAIGTAILPGVGTVVGGLLGGLL
jgi:hypothetical protein